MQKYGELIRNLRNESGISRDVLANILLVPADKLDEIEKGTGTLSESGINLCANIFNVSSEALKDGQLKPRATADELLSGLEKFASLYRDAVKSQSYLIGIINGLVKNERFEVRIPQEEKYGFGIFDMESDAFVKDENGCALFFDTAAAALEAVKQLEEQNREYDRTESVEKSITEEQTENIQENMHDEPDLPEENKETHMQM